MKRTRAIAPLVIAAALVLTGCSAQSSGPSEDASGAKCLAAGDASKAVAAEGDAGTELKLTSKTPVKAEKLQRSVLEAGSGETPAEGDTVNVSMTIFNGADGSVITQFPEGPLQLDKAGLTAEPLTNVIYEAARCSTPDQRVAIAGSFADFLGDATAEEVGIEGLTEKDSLVAVMDFAASEEQAEPAAACEKLTPRDEKYPEVDLGDGKSEPKITIPECMEPPTELEVEVLVEGDGAVVEKDQSIMTNYVGVKWNGAERFDGNWTETGVLFSTAEGALIDGFTQAMVGQKIGSTILVTMPPEMGYGGHQGHELEKDTLTFVLQLVSEADEQ